MCKSMNDFRPVALTSILCKFMEQVMVKDLIIMVGMGLDLYSFPTGHSEGL